MENKIKNRKGKIIIDRRLIMDAEYEVLKAIFSEFYPLAAEPNHDIHFYNSILYWGICKEFDIVEEGSVTPTYEIIISIDYNKNNTIKKVNVKYNKV